jgi:hypothetical protein
MYENRIKCLNLFSEKKSKSSLKYDNCSWSITRNNKFELRPTTEKQPASSVSSRMGMKFMDNFIP